MGSETAQLDLSGESDESIMLFMGAGTSQERSQAFSEFYRRQAGYLYGVIGRWCRMNRGHLLDPDDLFQEVIWHVYNHADTYEPRGKGDPEVERRNLRAWLGMITVNQIKTKLREERLGFRLVDISILEEIGREPFVLPHHVLEEDTPGHQMELLLDAFSSLSDKEQSVLRLLWLEKDFRRPGARLKANVTREIAASLGTTPENLRQINHRAMEKLNDYISKHSPQKDRINGKKTYSANSRK